MRSRVKEVFLGRLEPLLTVDQLFTDLSGDGAHHVLGSKVSLEGTVKGQYY